MPAKQVDPFSDCKQLFLSLLLLIMQKEEHPPVLIILKVLLGAVTNLA